VAYWVELLWRSGVEFGGRVRAYDIARRRFLEPAFGRPHADARFLYSNADELTAAFGSFAAGDDLYALRR
jgi:hypothetical protein